MRDRLRIEAKGQECFLRIPSVCNFNNETTVLAHIRRGGVAGMGQKPKDIIGVHACSSCHDVLDHRNSMGAYTAAELDGYALDALCRQLDYWISKGSVAIRA